MEDFRRIRMVNVVPERLILWWDILQLDKETKGEITYFTKSLTSLIEFEPSQSLVQALVKFWDPQRVVFRFGDLELTPTLGEIAGMTRLECYGREMLLPKIHSTAKFQASLRLKKDNKLRCFRENWVTLDYLFERFGRPDSYQKFRNEFKCTKETWRKKRSLAFVTALLGLLVFPMKRGKIRTCLGLMAKIMFEGFEDKKFTIVPTILAEMFRALTKCKNGATYFEGCNFLLHLWALDHTKLRHDWSDSLSLGGSDPIKSYKRRLNICDTIEDYEHWVVYFTNLTNKDIMWTFCWVPRDDAVLRSEKRYYIELIGLTGLQPYAPLRVLRQFGRKQVIPLHADMSTSAFDFKLGPNFELPRAMEILKDWNSLQQTLNLGEYTCTPEYSEWIQEDIGPVKASAPGKPGFEDCDCTFYIRLKRIVSSDTWTQLADAITQVKRRSKSSGAFTA